MSFHYKRFAYIKHTFHSAPTGQYISAGAPTYSGGRRLTLRRESELGRRMIARNEADRWALVSVS